MMVIQFALVLVVMTVSEAQLSLSYAGRQPVPAPPPAPTPAPNPHSVIFEAIQALQRRITRLQGVQDNLSNRETNLETQSDSNSIFTDNFENVFRPQIKRQQKAQDGLISDLESTAKELLFLAGRINTLNSTVGQLQGLEEQIKRQDEEIRNRLQENANAQASEAGLIAQISAQLDQQVIAINSLTLRSHQVRRYITVFQDTIATLLRIVSSEQAQTFEFTMTKDNDDQTQHISVDFGGRNPYLSYGITAIHFGDHTESYSANYNYAPSYGQGYAPPPPPNPSINYDVDASVDINNKKVRVTLSDRSTGGWKVDKVVLIVCVYYVDNQIVPNPYN